MAEPGETVLLDTSVFYACGSEEARDRFRAQLDGKTLVTAASSPLEILSGTKEKDFAQRRRALQALRALVPAEQVLMDSDAAICRAFSVVANPLSMDLVNQAIDAGCNASSLNELETALPEELTHYASTGARGLAKLAEWDTAAGEHFMREMGNDYARVDSTLREIAKEAGLEGHHAATAARLMRAMAITVDPVARMSVLVALATRAELISQADLSSALQPGRFSELEALWQRACAAHDSSLDGFIEVYVHYHGYLAATGRSVGKNDALDLEPFVFFGSTAARYATGEKLWLAVAELASPECSYDVHAIVAKHAGKQ